MRFLDHYEKRQKDFAAAAARRPAGQKRAEAVARRNARESRARERAATRLATMPDADRALAATIVVPTSPQEREEMARSLVESPSGRRRSHADIAAIMGLSTSRVSEYLEGVGGRAAPRRQPRPPKPPVAKINIRGSWVRRSRKLASLTVAELARKLTVTQDTIKAWEAGQKNPSARDIERIKRACDL